MAITREEQFLIARQRMDEEYRKQQEEYRKNVEALERVQRFLDPPIPGVDAQDTPKSAVKNSAPKASFRGVQSPSLIGSVLQIVLSKPGVSVTSGMILRELEGQGFSFAVADNERRIVSIGQALRKLCDRPEPQIRLHRSGSGRRPNQYRALAQEINPAHTMTAEEPNEVTM